MPATTRSSQSAWDAQKLLAIISPATGNFCCAGWAQSKNRRCMRQLARHNREAAEQILAILPQICHDEHKLQAELNELAWLAHCPKDHRHQAPGKAAKWRQVINDVRSAKPEATKALDDLDEIAQIQRMLDELCRLQDEQKARAEDRRREQERRQEERRQQDEEREQHEQRQREEAQRQAEAEEEARRQAEAEEAARREAHQRQEEARREEQRREEKARQQQEARRRASAEAREDRERREREMSEQEWTESWRRYERDWEHMQHLDTSTPDEHVRDRVPWPVKSGRWQDVTEANIRAFLRKSPGEAAEKPRKFRSVLRRQAMRWHEDRLRYKFPRIAEDEGCRRLATLVQQVINSLMAPLPSL